MTASPIYLDYNATTPVAPEVLECMLPFFSKTYGNAASRSHVFGWEAEDAVSRAREQIAALLEAEPQEIIFTSGATESVNLGIKGMFEGLKRQGDHVVTVSTEHKAVLDTCKHVESLGGQVTFLPVDPGGMINLDQFEASFTNKTILVSIMFVNNETGVIQPLEEIAEICHSHKVILMSDATQAAGKIKTIPASLKIGMMAFSSHKMYGPKGVGALYVNRDLQHVLAEQMNGGGHERGLRSGTLNVTGIVGFGKAAQIAREKMAEDQSRLFHLRDLLEKGLMDKITGIRHNTRKTDRIYQTSNLYIEGVESEQLLLALGNHVAISSGSACTSAEVLPSHVLINMGMTDDRAMSSIRISLGRPTTEQDIKTTIQKMTAAVEQIRENNPMWASAKDHEVTS